MAFVSKGNKEKQKETNFNIGTVTKIEKDFSQSTSFSKIEINIGETDMDFETYLKSLEFAIVSQINCALDRFKKENDIQFNKKEIVNAICEDVINFMED